ncbi:MAG: Zn-dependent protease with chaperone function [Desulforhopalus sp.]|jgi:Zn-dependent protease with chaperone function
MEYKASLPEHNDNVSHDQPVREFILLFFGITIFLLVVFWTLGLFVDRAVDYISPEMEGIIFSSAAVSTTEEIDGGDPRQAELQRIVDYLRGCVDITYPLEVRLIDSDEANALAFPGGRIFVLNGLLDKVLSENGLSFVLAHELAHFKNRDHLRGMGRAIVFTAIAAVTTGASSNITQLLATASSFNNAQYSQERESLADQQAMQALNCYYGHVGGATEFFESMSADHQKSSYALGHYFSSHPEGLQRINNLHQLAREQNFVVKEVLTLPPVFKTQD